MNNDSYYRISIQADKAQYDVYPHLFSLTIEEDSSKPAKLTMELNDSFMVLSHALQEGMNVEVDLGTKQDHSIVFRGQIYRVEGSFPEKEIATLKLTAYDRSLAMGLRKRNRQWTRRSLGEIVRDIAKNYFSQGQIDIELKGDPSFTGNGIRQQDETDLAFLLRLAANYGCEMCVLVGIKGDKLLFRAQSYIMKTLPQVTLYYMRTDVAAPLLSFKATTEVSKIQLPRIYTGIDFRQGKQIQNTISPVEVVGNSQDRFFEENLTEFYRQNPELDESLVSLMTAAKTTRDVLRKQLGSAEFVALPGFVTDEDLSVLVENQFSISIYGMRASGTTAGNHRIHAQATIDIANVGGQFSGIWYVSQVRHIVNDGGYHTEFECQR